MKRYLRLIRAFWANSLSLDLEYRLNFLISAVTAVFSFAAGLLVLDVMFTHADGLGGWNFHQALALYGVYLFLEEFCVGFLAQNVGRLPEHIQRGNLDFVLLKPVSSQVQISLSNFAITGLPAYLLGLSVIA